MQEIISRSTFWCLKKLPRQKWEGNVFICICTFIGKTSTPNKNMHGTFTYPCPHSGVAAHYCCCVKCVGFVHFCVSKLHLYYMSAYFCGFIILCSSTPLSLQTCGGTFKPRSGRPTTLHFYPFRNRPATWVSQHRWVVRGEQMVKTFICKRTTKRRTIFIPNIS